MAALRSDEKYSRTNVYAPLFRRIDGLEAYINLLRLDMSSRVAGPSNIRHSLLTNLCQDQIINSQIALVERPYINKIRCEIPPILAGPSNIWRGLKAAFGSYPSIVFTIGLLAEKNIKILHIPSLHF